MWSWTCAVADELATLTAELGRRVDVDPAVLMTGRAALLGLQRGGRTSSNGSCRLLAARDGWIAVNLPRPSDVDSVGAIVGEHVSGDPWPLLERAAATRRGAELVTSAQLLGVAAAQLPVPGAPRSDDEPPWRVVAAGERRPKRLEGAVVIDLSSLWAGPVCAQLLGRAGARVIKVESAARPDGARLGNRRFFDWLHAGHECVALDLGTAAGRDHLRRLIARADVVIEASRPRALRQLGIDADAVVAQGNGTTWVSITGYGREGDEAGRVAFGDDAAVAGGLVAYDDTGDPVFAGDAIADPLTGLHAAVAALRAMRDGGGALVDVAMRDVAAHVADDRVTPLPGAPVEADGWGGWELVVDGARHRVREPVPPPAGGAAPALGAHTAAVLAER